ncbi:MAG TPA: hypothetical protein VMF89_18175 [Polyangiales bacterium]|nr:hypothetical protein [Polyangiales bacterium]
MTRPRAAPRSDSALPARRGHWHYPWCLLFALLSCTDLGVVGERARPSAGAGGSQNAGASGKRSAAGSGGSDCLFGVCELPPFCTAPDAFCILCNSDADCVRDPVDRFCSPVFSTCVACLSNADCGPEAPYCEGGECDFCKEDDQCPEDERCNDGTCEPD